MSRKILTIFLYLLLAACNLPNQQANSNVQAWIDMPLPNTVFYPSDPCRVIAHGASPDGIAAFELSLNGFVIANISNANTKETLGTLDHECSLLQPGENIIVVRAQDLAGAWSETTQTTVFLAEAESNVELTPIPPTEFMTPTYTPLPTLTPTPTFTPTPPADSGVIVERKSTDVVYFGGSSCGPNEVTIAVRAVALDEIKAVVLFYRFQTGNSSTEFQGTSMNPVDGDLYERTLNLNSLLGGVVPFDLATLQYQIVVQQNDGDMSIRTPVLSDITVEACGGVTAACGTYTSEASCVEHGCNWIPKPGIVPIFECQNP